jgi:hypothetical protein
MDLHNIVMQLKTMLSDEIQSTIQIGFKTELENAVKGFIDEIDTLEKENAQLRDEVIDLTMSVTIVVVFSILFSTIPLKCIHSRLPYCSRESTSSLN